MNLGPLRAALRDYNQAGGSGVRESAYAGERLALAIGRFLENVTADPKQHAFREQRDSEVCEACGYYWFEHDGLNCEEQK